MGLRSLAGSGGLDARWLPDYQEASVFDMTKEEQLEWFTDWEEANPDLSTPEKEFEYYAEEAGDVDVMQPVYDDTGRIIGWNATGDIDDPLEKDYSSLWEQLDIAKETEIPGLEDWMTEQDHAMYDPMESQTMADMQALIDQLTTGPTAMELGDAQAYAAQFMGIDPADYQIIVGGLLQTATADIGTLEGFSPEERALRERASRTELRGMEERAVRMIDNIMASTGSTSRSYAAADQALRQINDAQIQQSMAIADEDYRRKVNQSEAAERQWAAMVQAGQMGQAQYLDLLQQNKSMAFQGYAVQVNTMMQQNQQYLQEYSADMMAIEANINNIYKAINMEIGIDEKAMSDIERQYQMEMAPILAQMEMALAQIELAKSAEEEAFSLWDFIVDAAKIITPFVLFGPAGGAAGAAAVYADNYPH